MARAIRPYAARRGQLPTIPKFDPEERELAWKSIAAFRAMLPTLRTFARAVSRNPQLDVAITTDKPYTNGNVIYIQPPMELGRDLTHDRPACGRRAANGKQLCPACQVHEVIMFYIFHEIGHVYFNSALPVTQKQHNSFSKLANEWHPTGACGHLAEIAVKSYGKKSGIELLATLNQYLPMIFNAFEDARVNEATFRARPGLRGVFDANIERIMQEGSEISPGNWHYWIDEPLDAQFMIGLYLIASGHFVEGRLNSDVVTALRTPVIEVICENAITCSSAHETFELAIEAFRAAQFLGYCVVPKCELVPQLPGPPSDEDEAGDSEEARPGDSAEDSEESDQDSSDSPEDTDSSSDDSGGESSSETRDASDNDGQTGEPSGSDSEEVDDDDSADGRDDSDSADNDSEGTGGGDSPADDTEEANDSADPSDGAGDSGGNSQGERPESSDSEQSELEEDNGGSASQPSSGRPGESDQDDVREGESSGSEGELVNPVREDDRPQDDGSGVDGSDDDGGSRDESAPVNEDAQDTEEALDEEECEHVGEYECRKCGADLAVWDDDAWEGDGGSDMTPVDAPSGPVGDIEPSIPQHGTPDDAATALGRFLMHPMGESSGLLDDIADGDIEEVVGASEHEAMDAALAKLVETAISQALYFAKESGVVQSVCTAEYPDDRIMWNIRTMSREIRTSISNILDSVIPTEDLIGHATQKMRRLFQENKMTKRDRNLRSGRLDMRSLARRAPVQDDRLFGKKTKPRGKSYAVVIGIDCSGSTDEYSRNLRIKRCAMAQAEVLTRLGIPWAGYAHTAFRTPLDHNFQFTSWDETYYVYLLPFKLPSEQWTDAGREKLSAVRPLSENLDGHTLEQYINTLVTMEGDEKILLYYTDGQMPASNYSEEREVLIEQCNRAKKLGIHLLGVGINTSSPEQYGMETVQVDSDEDILRVIEQLEQILSR